MERPDRVSKSVTFAHPLVASTLTFPVESLMKPTPKVVSHTRKLYLGGRVIVMACNKV